MTIAVGTGVPFTPLTIPLLIMFVTGGIVCNLAWVQIFPVLECLGHVYEPWKFKKFKNGFFKTLYEYKRYQIAEKKPLTWWWAYWAGLWSAVCSLVCIGILIVLYE